MHTSKRSGHITFHPPTAGRAALNSPFHSRVHPSFCGTRPRVQRHASCSLTCLHATLRRRGEPSNRALQQTTAGFAFLWCRSGLRAGFSASPPPRLGHTPARA